MQLLNRRRTMGASQEEPFDGFLIRGKFTDTSTPDQWWCKIDRVKVDLSPFVDPASKEFEYKQKSKPKTLTTMWEDNTAIESLYDLRGTDNLVSIYKLFSYCSSIKFADISNIPAPLSERYAYEYLFYYSSIRDAIINIDMSLAPTTDGMFSLSNYLRTIEGIIRNISKSIIISSSYLSNESAMLFINGLAEVETPQTIKFSASTYNTLSPEQITIAESKNWIVARA